MVVESEICNKHPCVLVEANPINKAHRTVVVVPLSSSTKVNPPLTIAVTGMERQTMAIDGQTQMVDKARLLELGGKLSDSDLKKLEEG